MRKIRFLPLAAALALAWTSQAHAAPDSLFQAAKGDGKTFTIYYLHSKADGTTVIDEATMNLTDRPSEKIGDQKVMLTGPLVNMTLRWSPNGMQLPADTPMVHEKIPILQLVLQGEFIVDVSNGQTVHVKPGNFLLQEDSTGYGHHMHCLQPKGGMGCIQMNLFPMDPATFFKNLQK